MEKFVNISQNKNSIFSNIVSTIRDNIKIIIYSILIFFIIIIGIQIYILYKNKEILEISIIYNNTKNSDSQLEFIENMKIISEKENFFGLMASLELINNKIQIKKFNESYNEYISLIKNNNTDNLYKTLLSIHASYNLLDKIEPEKIYNLLSFIDKSFESFIGHRLEILYLLSLTEKNTEKTNNLYNQINKNEKISLSIKERVNKINEFEKYK